MGICTKERKGDVSRILGAPGSSVKYSTQKTNKVCVLLKREGGFY